jgi:hypothetical protein
MFSPFVIAGHSGLKDGVASAGLSGHDELEG